MLQTISILQLNKSLTCKRILQIGKKDVSISNQLGKKTNSSKSIIDSSTFSSYEISGAGETQEDLDVLAIEAALKNINEEGENITYDNDKNNFIHNDDISVYPFDKISDIKEKIFALTGIYPACQHLWILNDVIGVIPLSYNMTIEDIPKEINMPKFLQNKDTIDDIVIETKWAHSHELIKIYGNDWFETIGNIYKRYGTNIIYLMDLAEFPIRDNIDIIYYGFVRIFYPMFATFGCFKDYIEDRQLESWSFKYPSLAISRKLIYNKYIEEAKIFDNLVEEANIERLESLITNSITHATITTSSVGKCNLQIHLLFDYLNCDKHGFNQNDNVADNTIEYIRAFYYNDSYQPVDIVKIVKNTKKPSKTIIPYNCLVIKLPNITIFIFSNGKILMKVMLDEQLNYGFDEVLEYVKIRVEPILAHINKSKYVFSVMSLDKLPEVLERDNIHFSEVSMVLKLQKSLTEKNYMVVKKVFDRINTAGIWDNGDINEYFLRKGMYENNISRLSKLVETDNTYSWLITSSVKQRWNTLFAKTRNINITKRFTDIHFSINGIREGEYKYFYVISLAIMLLIEQATTTEKTIQIKEESTPIEEILKEGKEKPLKVLKEIDPALHKLNKVPYSKICQKKFQPIPILPKYLDKIPKEYKARIVPYWNFTTSSPIYYLCPNSQNPHLRFIVGKHPKGFCIPCCKPLSIEESTQYKKNLHNKCINEHIVSKTPSNIINRYITQYSKNITPGRIIQMPRNIWSEKITNIYLYSVYQHENRFDTLWECLAKILNISSDKIKEDALYKIDMDKDITRKTIIKANDKNPITYAKWYLNINMLIIKDETIEFNPINEKLCLIYERDSQLFPIFTTSPHPVFIFEKSSTIYNLISSLNGNYIAQKKLQDARFNLDSINEFITYNKSWKIHSFMINKQGYIYNLYMQYKDKYCIVPIIESIIPSIELPKKIPKVSQQIIDNFITDYNKWADEENIIDTSVAMRYKNKIIGIISFNLQFYMATPSENCSYIDFLYNPQDISKNILYEIENESEKKSNQNAPHLYNISKTLYDIYWPRIFMLNLLNKIVNTKDKTIRKRINEIIHEYNFSKAYEGLVRKLTHIKIDKTDISSIINIIKIHYPKKSMILSAIEHTHFIFDHTNLKLDTDPKAIHKIIDFVEIETNPNVDDLQILPIGNIKMKKEHVNIMLDFLTYRMRNKIDLFTGFNLDKSFLTSSFSLNPNEEIIIL